MRPPIIPVWWTLFILAKHAEARSLYLTTPFARPLSGVISYYLSAVKNLFEMTEKGPLLVLLVLQSESRYVRNVGVKT